MELKVDKLCKPTTKTKDLELIDDELAIYIFMNRCGERTNPIGFFKDALAQYGYKANYRSLRAKGLIKVTEYKGSIGWYSSWMQIAVKGKNLYKKTSHKFKM